MLPKVSYNAYAANASSMQSQTKSVNFGIKPPTIRNEDFNAAYEIAAAIRNLTGANHDEAARWLYHIANGLKLAQNPHDVGVLLDRVANAAEKGPLPADIRTRLIAGEI